MTVFVPGWAQGGTYTAQQDRVCSNRSADWDEGVASRNDFEVVQRAAGANLTVDIGAGACIVQGDDQANQGNYTVFSDAVTNLGGFVATSSNTRYDVVGVQINDPNAGGAAGSNAVLVRIAGTQAASPVIPAIPNSCLPLAIVGPFTTSSTSITNSMIHDVWTGTGPTGVTGMRLLQGFRDSPGTTKETYNPIAPNGWLIEDGTAISRTTYARLFKHFGVTFGAGNGSTTFNLPDSRGRVLVALDNQGANGDGGRLTVSNTLGGVGGEELHTLSVAELAVHHHAGTVHSHGVDPPSTPITWDGPGGQVLDLPLANGVGGNVSLALGVSNLGSRSVTLDVASYNDRVDIAPFTTDVNGGANGADAGSGTAHNNMPPYIFGYRIVRT